MSSIFKWMIVLLLLLAVAGGSGLYWCFSRSDVLLQAEVLKHLRNLAPELTFGIEQARFDFSGRIRVRGLSLQLPGEDEPALYIEEAIATLDDQQMTDFEKVSIQRLRLIHPQLHAVRDRDGHWNWQGIAWKLNPTQPVPEILIEHGNVVVELQRGDHGARKLSLADVNLTSMPAAARKLTAAVSARIEPAGPFSATIDADLDGPPFKLEAKWLRLPVDDELLELIGEISPPANVKLQEARQVMARLAATQVAATPIGSPHRNPGNAANGLNSSSVSLQSQIPPLSQAGVAPFGFKCHCDFHCRLEWTQRGAPLDYQLLAEMRSGQISNVLLPFPLYEIRGSVYADARHVVFRDLRAENGATRLSINTQLVAAQPPRVNLHVRNLQLDEALKARLPETLRKLIHSYSLSGLCDLDLGTIQDGQALKWEGDLRLTDGFAAHEKFPYPIRNISGTVRLRGSKVELEGQGKASGVPVTLTGWILNPGPANESEFLIKADGVPINSTLLDSSPETLHKALTELSLQGRHDVRLRFVKAAGIGQKYHQSAAVKLRDCSCMLKSFPYRIHRLQGLVFWDEELITFQELKGEHDETRLTASGRFLRVPTPGRLELGIQAENAAFDRSLEAAIPASLHQLWREFQPSGRFDVDTRITWVPGQACQVVLPRIKVTDAEIAMKSFPWPMRSITGEFSYEAPRLIMKSVTAQHDDTQIRGRGLVTFVEGQPWRVRFDELHVDDLVPNSTFRKALPAQLQVVFDTLNPSGKFSIATTRQGTVELAGDRSGQAIHSAWDIQVLLAGCDLTAGVRVEDIHGRVDLKGSNDGRVTNFVGQLDLDSISVFRQTSGLAYQISRVIGPIRLDAGQLTGGSRAMATPSADQPLPQVPLAERISGDFIDGKMTLDVVADLQAEPIYRLQATLSRGKLERYAQQYLRGQSGLAGIMNGWLQLWGEGNREDQVKGRGELQIAPAALYELPLFVQIFRALRLDASDRTAFDRADVLYRIENSRFNFDAIDLVGKALSLRGRGYIRFDGGMQFDFYSMLARNQIRIPIIHEIAGVLSRGWVGVKVTGNVGAPETRIVPVPEFDEAMKQFLGSFEQPQPRQPRILPRTAAPAEPPR